MDEETPRPANNGRCHLVTEVSTTNMWNKGLPAHCITPESLHAKGVMWSPDRKKWYSFYVEEA